jgi:putative DNA primase/helicase
MADFEALMVAAAPAFGWEREAALEAYRANRKSVIERVIEADAVASALQRFVSNRPAETPGGSGPDGDGCWWNDGTTDRWTGSMTRLLGELVLIVSDEERREKTWPRNAAKLSGQIMRAAPALRAVGINVQRRREGEGRLVEISTAMKNFGRR